MKWSYFKRTPGPCQWCMNATYNSDGRCRRCNDNGDHGLTSGTFQDRYHLSHRWTQGTRVVEQLVWDLARGAAVAVIKAELLGTLVNERIDLHFNGIGLSLQRAGVFTREDVRRAMSGETDWMRSRQRVMVHLESITHALSSTAWPNGYRQDDMQRLIDCVEEAALGTLRAFGMPGFTALTVLDSLNASPVLGWMDARREAWARIIRGDED